MRRRQLEDERLRTLFAIPTTLVVWLFFEIGRRQKIGEAREEQERKLVHGELSQLRDEVSAARERAAGAAEAEKARREQSEDRWQPWQRRTTIVVTVATVVGVWVYLIAYHIL